MKFSNLNNRAVQLSIFVLLLTIGLVLPMPAISSQSGMETLNLPADDTSSYCSPDSPVEAPGCLSMNSEASSAMALYLITVQANDLDTLIKPIKEDKTMADTDKFLQALKGGGAPPSRSINIILGRIFNRFHVQGDKPGTKNGWYICRESNGVLVGAFGCFKRGIKERYCSKGLNTMAPVERLAYKAQNEKMDKQYQKELEAVRADCRAKAKSMWVKSTKDDIDEQPYAIRKEIRPRFARTNTNGNLVIPVRNISQELQGLQFIAPNGSKWFLTGTAKQGNFVFLCKSDDIENEIVICEGYATACSIRQATKLPVIAALDAGNLRSVAEAWRKEFPKLQIIIAGDDDHATDGNPGRTKAIEASKAVNGIVILPKFEDRTDKTDFNDMAQEQGLETVNTHILECIEHPVDYEADVWLEPIHFGNVDTPDIPCSLLPDWQGEYSQAVADSTQTPSGLSVMSSLAVVSTCLQKDFIVSPFEGYSEPVNLMTITALDSASRKSAVLKAMTEPMMEWEIKQAEALKDEAERVQHERDMILKSIEAIKSKSSKAETLPDERREALEEIKKLKDSMPSEIIIPKLWTDDITMEALQNLMVDHGEKMAVISAEGGFFEVMAGLYSGGNSNVNVILQSHAGEPVRVKRQGRSVNMQKPALTFGLCVQPDIISNLTSGNKARFRGNGLLARLLFCIPLSTVGTRDVTKHAPIPASIKARYFANISRLLSINPILDDSGNVKPRILTLSPQALTVWQEFSQDVETKQGLYGEYYYMRDWTGKLPGAVLRIAGLCHVVEHGKKNKIINKVTMRRALKLAKLLIIHAKVAFGMMGSDPTVSDAKVCLDWIIKNGAQTFRRSDMHRSHHSKFARIGRLASALAVLTERHIISDVQKKYTGRRPEIVYHVNPAVLKDCKA